jgi:hypothetical protein
MNDNRIEPTRSLKGHWLMKLARSNEEGDLASKRHFFIDESDWSLSLQPHNEDSLLAYSLPRLISEG